MLRFLGRTVFCAARIVNLLIGSAFTIPLLSLAATLQCADLSTRSRLLKDCLQTLQVMASPISAPARRSHTRAAQTGR